MAASIRRLAPPRHTEQIASASASVASTGRGGSLSRRSRVTMCATCSLPALPLPLTAALTSLGVCSATGSRRRAAHSTATPLAWAVPMTVDTLCWLNTRSTATASGEADPATPRARFPAAPDGRRGTRRPVCGRCRRRRVVVVRLALDCPEPTAGQAGIDAEHAHVPPSCSLQLRPMSEHLFGTLRDGSVGAREDAPSADFSMTSSVTS